MLTPPRSYPPSLHRPRSHVIEVAICHRPPCPPRLPTVFTPYAVSPASAVSLSCSHCSPFLRHLPTLCGLPLSAICYRLRSLALSDLPPCAISSAVRHLPAVRNLPAIPIEYSPTIVRQSPSAPPSSTIRHLPAVPVLPPSSALSPAVRPLSRPSVISRCSLSTTLCYQPPPAIFYRPRSLLASTKMP